MNSPFNVRYVLVSDYATIDHTGKLIVAGLYTEDLVVPSVPTILAALVVTILAEMPDTKRNFRLTVETPSGVPLIGGGGEIGPAPYIEGSRPRAILGFQFNQVVLSEGGDYKIMVSDAGEDSEKFEIHRFRLIVSSQAHAEATSSRMHREAGVLDPSEKPKNKSATSRAK
jgi:hypothetical protein